MQDSPPLVAQESRCPVASCNLAPVSANQELLPQSSASSVASVSPQWPVEVVASPRGAQGEYNTLEQLGNAAAAAPTKSSPGDCYTCVQLMNESGKVHLVLCLPPEYRPDLLEKMAYKQLRMDSAEAGSSGSPNPPVSAAIDKQR